MHSTTRLADHDTAQQFILPIDGQAQWQSTETGRWRTHLVVPALPKEHIIVPSFSMLADAAGYAFQCTLHHDAQNVPLAPVPTQDPPQFSAPANTTQGDQAQAAASISTHIDCWHTHAQLDKGFISIEVAATHPPHRYLASVSMRPIDLPPAMPPPLKINARETTNYSQLQADEKIRSRICSPTALAMALSIYQNSPTWSDTVKACYDPRSRAYGMWPLAIHWASSRGVLGAVEVFSDWQQVIACLHRGVPVVCSIRFGKGELPNAPLDSTGGHLVLLCGLDGDHVLVKDPAAATHDEVTRRYPADQFSKAWLARRGAAYIFNDHQTNAQN